MEVLTDDAAVVVEELAALLLLVLDVVVVLVDPGVCEKYTAPTSAITIITITTTTATVLAIPLTFLNPSGLVGYNGQVRIHR